MVRIAFSTVACPEWTLERVAESAGAFGFQGVELRSFGYGGSAFACEPGLTAARKVREAFAGAGVDIAGLATGLRYDDVVFPPGLGHALGRGLESVAATKPFVDLASQIGAPFIRVFAFETSGAESVRSLRRRVVPRLRLAADAARNTGARLVLENGGAFPTAASLAEVLDEVGSPDLAACYALHPAADAGEDPLRGVEALGSRLCVARIKDLRDGRPTALGAGTLPCRRFTEAVARCASCRWLVFEWDRAWVEGLADAEDALPEAARTLVQWIGAAGQRSPAGAPGSPVGVR